MQNAHDHERSSLLVMVGIATIILGIAAQIVSWDKYAIDIIPIQVKNLVSMTSPEDWEATAKMCWDIKKWDCVEHEYTKAAQVNRDQYVRLGQYLMRRLKFKKATEAFAIYFKNGGENPDASYSYAKALAEIDQDQEAAQHFERALAAHPEALSVPIVLSYVKSLMKAGKLAPAQKLIEDVRKQNSTSGAQFMEAEYNQIRKIKTASRE